MKKFFLVIFFLPFFLFSFILMPDAARSFKDIPSNYWAEDEIDYLISENIITGYSDGTFKPAVTLTRIQVAIMIQRAMDYPEENRPDPQLADIQPGSKYYSLVSTLVGEGVFNDLVYQGGYFLPNEPVSRVEMASILVKAFRFEGTTSLNFNDVESYHWAYRYIQKLVAHGVTGGTSKDMFSPDQQLNRVQFAAFLARAMDDRFKLPQSLPKPVVTIEDYIHTQDEINQIWQMYKPTYDGNPYVITPAVKSPFLPGKLNESFINDGVKMTNFVRFLSGLPPVTADSTLNDLSQYGAVVLATNNVLTHYPDKPASMSESFYQKGYKSTSSSNLYQFHESSPAWFFSKRNMSLSSPLAFTVAGYMSDSDVTNIDRVGHRRWILSPNMGKVGFGLASLESAIFSPMYVFDRSNMGLNWEHTSWPSKGYFPYQFLSNDDAWSVHLNQDSYRLPDINSVRVKLTRLNDQKEWNLDKSHNTITSNEHYFNVETQNFGNGMAIIFRPGDIETYENGTYKVTITGLQKITGEPTTIEYITYFFELKE